MQQVLKTMLENVRAKTPLVHNITNYVTVNDCANIVLACGASPIMADDAAEVEDIISSPIVKESIINNADCKILLDQRKYRNKFDQIQTLLGLTDKERAQVLSINLSNDPARRYKEVFISLGGVQSAVYATEVSDEEYLVRP
mgnify:CR=1 FL=1